MFPCIRSGSSLIPSLKRLYYRKENFFLFCFLPRRTSGLLSLLLQSLTREPFATGMWDEGFFQETWKHKPGQNIFIFICLTNCQLLIRGWKSFMYKEFNWTDFYEHLMRKTNFWKCLFCLKLIFFSWQMDFKPAHWSVWLEKEMKSLNQEK